MCSAYLHALFRTRGGGDERIRATLERARERRIGILLEGVGAWLPDPRLALESPALRTAVQGWIFFAEGAILRWLDHGGIDRDQLRQLLGRVLADALAAAARIDPTLGLDVAGEGMAAAD